MCNISVWFLFGVVLVVFVLNYGVRCLDGLMNSSCRFGRVWVTWPTKFYFIKFVLRNYHTLRASCLQFIFCLIRNVKQLVKNTLWFFVGHIMAIYYLQFQQLHTIINIVLLKVFLYLIWFELLKYIYFSLIYLAFNFINKNYKITFQLFLIENRKYD